jgi:hypothetical protein
MQHPVSDDEHCYFEYSATLRVHGADLPFEEIAKTLGISATHQHRAGEWSRPNARPYRDDAWQFTAPVPEEAELTEHLRHLWNVIEPHVHYLTRIDATVDVFCGYRSNNGAASFAVEADALQIFTALGVPFLVSVIVDSWLGEVVSEPTKH